MSTQVLTNRERRPEAQLGQNQGGTAPKAGPGAFTEIDPYRWIILIGLITASIMEVLDTTIINVALPNMAGNLNATSDEIAWVSTAYILSNVIVLPMTAWLSQRFGRKRYLVFSISLFLIASFFCGTSKSLNEVIFWRIMQGAGGAALLSTAQATLRQIFPKEQQGLVQSIFILGIVMAPTLGPTMGGIITDKYTWPWIFFVNIPIGLIAMALIIGFLHDQPNLAKAGAIDVPGIALLTVGLGSLQYVLEEGKRDDWFDSSTIVRLTIIAAVSLTALIAWELSPRNKAPVVNFRVLKNKNLTAGLILFLALGFGLYGGVFIFPMFVQNVLHFSPTATGLVLLPGGLATGVAAMFCGRALNGAKPLIDPRILIFFGMTIFIASMWMLGHLSPLSGEPDTRLGLIVRGLGLGFLFAPINFIVFSAVKGPEIAQASGLINLARQLGGSFGIAVLNTYISNQEAMHRANLVAYLNPSNSAFMARQQAIAHGLVSHGYSHEASHQASLHQLNNLVQGQAATMAYNDAFLLLGITFAVAVPAVFLLRQAKKAPAGGGGGH